MTEHLVHNERVKLKATTLNGMGIACFITAFIQNVFVNGLSDKPAIPGYTFVPVSVVFGLLGLGLHLLASRLLDGLREKTTPVGGSDDIT